MLKAVNALAVLITLAKGRECLIGTRHSGGVGQVVNFNVTINLSFG